MAEKVYVLTAAVNLQFGRKDIAETVKETLQEQASKAKQGKVEAFIREVVIQEGG